MAWARRPCNGSRAGDSCFSWHRILIRPPARLALLVAGALLSPGVPAWNGETSMRKIMLTVTCTTLLVAPAVALAEPIAGGRPLPIAKVSGEIRIINHLSEARRTR